MPDGGPVDDGVPAEYREAVLAGDPAAMMVAGSKSRTRDAAVGWYRRAAELGHPPALFAMALRDADEGNFEQARAWLASVGDGIPPRERIAMPRNLYARQGEAYPDGGWETSPAFLIVSPDGDRACRALARAAERFKRVTADGREAASWEEVADAWVPNWVSDVYLSAAGAAVALDTKGELTADMGGALLTVLSEELRRAEVTALVTVPPVDGSAFEALWVDPAASETEPEPPAEGPTAWFLIRPVRRTTVDGRSYFDVDFRTECGDWVRDRSRGARRDGPLSEDDLDLCRQLRDEPRPDRRGEPAWLRLAVDASPDPDSMPPPELQADD